MDASSSPSPPFLAEHIAVAWTHSLMHRQRMRAEHEEALGFPLQSADHCYETKLAAALERDACGLCSGLLADGKNLLHVLAGMPNPHPVPIEFDWSRPMLLASLAKIMPLVAHQLAARDDAGLTPLSAACFLGGPAGNRLVAEALLAAGAPIELADRHGETALHQAARAGSLEIVQLLLAAGADPSPSSHLGRSPLDLALANGRDAVVPLLLASLERRAMERDISASHPENPSPAIRTVLRI